jgi:DNA-binding XRE family transcriptional regulator
MLPSAGTKESGIGTFLKNHRQQLDRESKSLGSHLRVRGRVGRAVTQEEMAEALEVSRPWYAMLEADSAHPSPTLVNRMCDALSLDDDERNELFRLAIPELGPANAGEKPAVPLLGALSFQPSVGLELTITTASEIETTARRLADLREQYLTEKSLFHDQLRPRIVRSWIRSERAHVDPACVKAPLLPSRDADIIDLLEKNEALLRAARPVIRYLVTQLAGSGYAVIITDAGGRVLQMDGDADICKRLQKIELQPGGEWSERAAGTNAIGTALADARPLQLMGAEHFCDGWQHLTCTAAPIRDPQTSAVIGALDITGGYKLVRAHLLALIMQCAVEIEEALAPLL